MESARRQAYAALFSDDGDVVNVVGWRWKGRREIEQQLTAAYAVVFRDSRLTIADVEVRFLARDVAIAHVRWTMEGARTPPSIPEPRQGIQIQVCKSAAQHGGSWPSRTRTACPRRRFRRRDRRLSVRHSPDFVELALIIGGAQRFFMDGLERQ